MNANRLIVMGHLLSAAEVNRSSMAMLEIHAELFLRNRDSFPTDSLVSRAPASWFAL
jgi:hypothetical protein